jgi:tetratricopeptide (TPR) repeat protein
MKRFFLILLLIKLIFPVLVYCQVTENVDSLIARLEEESLSDTARVNLLNSIAANVFYNNAEDIEPYAKEALKIAENINYPKGIAQAYNNLGIYYRSKGIYNEAIDYFLNSLDIVESINDINGIARSYNLIGIIQYYLGNYDLSLDYYLKALKINQENNDKKWIAGNSNNIGMIYELKGDYEKALHYYLQSMRMNIDLGNENWVANNYGNIGSLYLKMNDPLSLYFFQKRLDLKIKLGDLEGISRSNYLIGKYYLSRENFDKAIPYFKTGYEVAKETGSLYDMKNNTKLLSESYAAVNRFKDAYEFHQLFKIYNDSLNLEENTQKITELLMQNQYRQEQRKTKLKQQHNRLRHGAIASGLFILVLFIIFLIYRQRMVARRNSLNQRDLFMANQMLSDELKFKEQLMEDNINYLMSKNQIITSTIERLNDLKHTSKPENHQIINEVVMELRSGINNDLWGEFDLRFKQIHSDFYNSLNQLFPGLTANEIKLCAFLKLNLKSRDIATITKQSIKSVETARSRLRKKMRITNKNISLSEYLNSI